MKKIANILNFVIALGLVLGACLSMPVRPVQAAGLEAEGVSPEAFLNEDGSLKLDGAYSGSFDLEGWDVQLDPARGPLFSPIADQGAWSALSEDDSPINGPIFTMVTNGTDVYVGGDFLNAAGIDEADYIVRWDGSTWQALGSNGQGDGSLSANVYALAMVGDTLYVGGKFGVTNGSGVYLPGAAYLAKWDGANWSAVDGSGSAIVNDWVHSLAAAGNTLYVGGRFTDAKGLATADYLIKLNLDTNIWSALGNNGAANGALNSSVYALAIDSTGAVYAGGFFTDVNNGGVILSEADRIAKWDPATGNWSALGNNGAGVGALNSIVSQIVIDANNNLYVGGNFYNVAGIPTADYVAKWDGSTWSALGSDGLGGGALSSYNINGTLVQTMLLTGNELYVGGFLTLVANGAADYLAKYDISTDAWSAVGDNGSGNGSLNDVVYALGYVNGSLYVGGEFYQVNNSGMVLSDANRLAKFSTNTGWSGFGGNSASLAGYIYAIAVDGTDVYVGGSFTNLNGASNLDYIAKWNGLTWSAVGNETLVTRGSLNGGVHTIVVSGDNVYAGGYFTDVNNNDIYINTADRIAKWNKTTKLWSALGDNGSDNGALTNGIVYTILVNGSDVYAGGSFTDAAGNAAADYIAKFDGANWSALSSNGAGNGALNSQVRALAFGFGDALFVGGVFTDVSNNGSVLTAADYIAKWDGNDWSALSGPSAALSSRVVALAISGMDLYVGGNFNNANGMAEADYLVRYTPGTGVWTAVNGALSILNGEVKALAVDGSNIYAGGLFTNVNNNGVSNTAADYVVKMDTITSNWSALSSNGAGNGSLAGYVHALAISNDDLLVSGEFVNVNNNGTVLKNADYIAVYGMAGSAAPKVSSSVRVGSNPTLAPTLDFAVTFSKPVTGVDSNDFSLTTTGVTGATITNVTGSDSAYTVTVSRGTNAGAIRLDVVDNDSIQDASSNALGGPGAGNGNYTGGEAYTVYESTDPVTFLSVSDTDGWILESSETSNKGGTKNNLATTLRVGDDAANKQYRTILSFDTMSLPDNAAITSVTLKFKFAGKSGTLPFSTHGNLLVDLCEGGFKANPILELGDFKVLCSMNKALTFTSTKVDNWYSQTLNPDYFDWINREGVTQFRLRFAKDDNNDFGADFLKIFSGDALTEADRPQLIIEYYIP